jgi:hypothetical protein
MVLVMPLLCLTDRRSPLISAALENPPIVLEVKEVEFVQGVELQKLLDVLQIISFQQARMATALKN